MDIAFHYFAIKTIARKAGFTDTEAEQIATYSQFIDDYNCYRPTYYSNVPKVVKDSTKYDLYRPEYLIYNYSLLTTGFWDTGDLVLEATKTYQREVISPFHFAPIDAASIAAKNNRTSPAEYGDGSYAANHLESAIAKYKAATTDTDKSRGLMYIGMALHTFADTYAHQLFTGFNEWANNMDIISVTNNITGADETELYKTRRVAFIAWLKKHAPSLTPMIGHLHMAHIPDYTHVSFSMSYPIDPQSQTADGVYTRSNTNEFVKASQKIFRILERVKGTTPLSDEKWNLFADKLKRGFLYDISTNVEKSVSEEITIEELIDHWWGIFPDYTYDYTRHAQFGGVVEDYTREDESSKGTGTAKTVGRQPSDIIDMPEDFYYYSMFAEDMLISLYGDKPRETAAPTTTAETTAEPALI
jgi:hypothetical protein